MDEKLKSYINSKVTRGKIECYVTIEALNADTASVEINHTLASAYVMALKKLSDEYNLKEDFGASTISRFPDVLSFARVRKMRKKYGVMLFPYATRLLKIHLNALR